MNVAEADKRLLAAYWQNNHRAEEAETATGVVNDKGNVVYNDPDFGTTEIFELTHSFTNPELCAPNCEVCRAQ